MLSVEAVLDPLGFVYLVQHPVSVLKNHMEVSQNIFGLYLRLAWPL